MRYLFYLSFVSFAKTICAVSFSTKNEVEIQYNINFKSKCQSTKERFAIFNGLSVADCVTECGLRKHCVALNFWRHTSRCELYHLEEEESVTDGGRCIHILSTDIEIQELPCVECSLGEVCDVNSRTCLYKECPRKDLPENSEAWGNVFAIGGTVHFKCDEDYTTGDGQQKAICLDNGQWDASECIRSSPSCGDPPSITNASVVLDKVNGTFYPDTATVTCSSWFQTRKNTITCTITGDWEETTCADCYLDTPWTYTGKRNWTETGFPCLRWDSPEAIAYGYTNLNYYTEATLSEAENYCRNPESIYWDPWCITTNTNIDMFWEYCNIERCE